MKDHILFDEVSEVLGDAYDWIKIWLEEGYTKEELIGAFSEMIREVEEGEIK